MGTQHTLSIPFLALAFAGVSLAQGLPPPEARPANRKAAQVMAENDAARLLKDMSTHLVEKPRADGRKFPFLPDESVVIPGDANGRPQFHKEEKYRILSISMRYPEEALTANARGRIVGGGDGRLVFQHITLKGEDGAKLAVNYATRRVAVDLRNGAARATGGLIVKGNRIGALEDGTRFLAHEAQEARSIAMNQVRQFAHMSFEHSGGKDESFQLEVFVMGPGELVITLPSDLDGEQLLEAGFDKTLLDEMMANGRKVPGQGKQVSYILSGNASRSGAIEDDLRFNRTRGAGRDAQMREQGGPSDGATQRLPGGGE